MDRIFKAFDDNPMIPGGLFLLLIVMAVMRRRQKKAETQEVAYQPQPAYSAPQASYNAPGKPTNSRDFLSQELFRWSPRDAFIMRDLVRSVAVFGATGSGKTSGSGMALAKAVVNAKGRRFRNESGEYGGPIGGLILASKPEDKAIWQKIFYQAGRHSDLAIFTPGNPYRFNFINYIQQCGGDTRDITEFIMVIGETLEQGETHGHDHFWKEQNRRMIHCAVEVIRLAKRKVTAPDLQQFITGAAQKVEALNTPEFKNSFHGQCLRAAYNNAKTDIEKHDFGLAFQYWKDEYPAMPDKTRGSIQVGVMGILHVFNTGMVKELVSGETNCTPAAIGHGMWVLVDMPPSSYGSAGRFISAGWKYLTQRHMLNREANEDTPVCVIWCDEAQEVVNSFDATFLAMCRSHRACMVYLTQSIHAYYTKLREAGEHQTDSFLTNFYHKIFHAVGDDKTAAYASSLIGRRLKTRVNTSTSPQEGNAYDALFGQQKVSSSTSQSIENIMENREFMQNLRTGGRENGLTVDAVVVRSGQPFSTGEAFLKVSFKQE